VPMTYKLDCGRQVDISFFEAVSCRNIRTENAYNIILMSKGSLTLRVNDQRVRSQAPCVLILKENLNVDFISSQKLSAQNIHFDVAFLYRSATFEIVNSGKYEKLMNKLDLVPLNVFHSLDFLYVLALSEVEYIQVNSFFAN